MAASGEITGKFGATSVVAVGGCAELGGELRRLFPEWDVRCDETYLVGIAELGEHRADLVFAYVDPSQDDIREAVAGLREAAGDSKVILCCEAEGEPLARELAGLWADEYVVCPLRADEVETALAKAGFREMSGGEADVEVESERGASMAELAALGEIVSRLDAPADEFLKSTAELLRAAFNATNAGVVVEGMAATTEGSSSEPVMTEPLTKDSGPIGYVAIGPPRVGAYGESDRAKLKHYARLISNLTTAALEHRKFHELAYTDELSGLPNRRYLLHFLEKQLARARREKSVVTLLMFDVDFFKRYNDEFGHDAGDEIIKGCGELFRRNCRDHDVVTRYGGDEFAVVFWDKEGTRRPGSRHPSDILPLIERFRRSLRDHDFRRFRLPEAYKLTISGGLASFPADAERVEDLITRADEALLRAKRDGKNRIFLGGDNGGPAMLETRD